MIERVTMYIAKCDHCGEILQDGEIVAWADADEAQRMAEESEWREINGRLFCPDCYEVDEDTDEYVEKTCSESPNNVINGYRIDDILRDDLRDDMINLFKDAIAALGKREKGDNK